LSLWQIRQFPKEPRNRHARSNLARFAKACILLVFSAQVIAQPDATSETPATASAGDSAAQEYLEKALTAIGDYQSIQARLVEQIQITTPPIRMTGSFQEQGRKTRLELKVKLRGDSQGTLLEVSDGDLLWSEMALTESKQVSLRDLKQIAAALADTPTTAAADGSAGLGLGGLTGLLTSLHRTMTFDQMREESDSNGHRIVIQGQWNDEFARKWKKKPDDPLPAYIPDRVRIYFDAASSFPTRLVYLKRNPEKGNFRPILRLEFEDVKFNEAIDAEAFQYTPPEGIVPEDLTQQYIDQLKPRTPPAAGETPATVPAK
jgi:hypothetical protein